MTWFARQLGSRTNHIAMVLAINTMAAQLSPSYYIAVLVWMLCAVVIGWISGRIETDQRRAREVCFRITEAVRSVCQNQVQECAEARREAAHYRRLYLAKVNGTTGDA